MLNVTKNTQGNSHPTVFIKFSYERHLTSFTLLEGQLFTHERLYVEIPLIEYGVSSET